jgi:hypothetical protein
MEDLESATDERAAHTNPMHPMGAAARQESARSRWMTYTMTAMSANGIMR